MKNKPFFIFSVLIAITGLAGYFAYENYLLKENQLVFEDEALRSGNDCQAATKKLNGNIKDLNAVIDITKEELATTTDERDDYKRKYKLEKNRMDELESQISDIQGTVGTLEKLSQTDPELLKKYSKVYFLNENFVPESFVKIDSDYTYNPKEDYLFYSKVWPFLEELLSAAESDEIDLKIISAFRSFDAQTDLKWSYKVTYGTGANKFSADQGYSEHQLGTTVDFTTSVTKATFTGFEKTPAYDWLLDNAYKYGFIMSYPQGNQYYQYEPWHWRFVGRDLAEGLYDDGDNFYDLDQREIDQYLISFFD
jgi:LAS superfamily LD-carboxypeptidase LdcB